MNKLPAGHQVITATIFDATAFEKYIFSSDIFVRLLGAPHPSLRKKKLFKTIDLAFVKESVQTCSTARLKYFIYVSVAQTPTSIMKEYQKAP